MKEDLLASAKEMVALEKKDKPKINWPKPIRIDEARDKRSLNKILDRAKNLSW
jgi:hypothetical protein